MYKIRDVLTSIDGVESIHETRGSEKGRWHALVSIDITKENLNKMDHIIRSQTTNTYGYLPRRAAKGAENVN